MSDLWLGRWLLGIETLLALSLLWIAVELRRLRRVLEQRMAPVPRGGLWDPSLAEIPSPADPSLAGTLHMPEGWFERRVAELGTLRPPPPPPP